MNKAELLEENATLRRALYRPERSRFTQRRADLLEENKQMRAELASYAVEIEPERRQVKRKLRASRILRKLNQ
jgi:hypothetical protein